MAGQKRLLVVDDDKVHRTIYSSIAAKVGFTVDLVSSLEQAQVALNNASFQCVLLDLMLGDFTGADVLKIIARLPVKPQVLLVSGASPDVIEQTLGYGRELGIDVSGPIWKPVDVARLRFHLRRIANAIDIAAKAAEDAHEADYVV